MTMPHQGIVALSISAFSIVLTLGILVFSLTRERQNQAANRDEH